MTDARKLALQYYANACSANCGTEEARVLHVHHIDGNSKNNEVINLMLLCPTCHERITKGIWKVDPATRVVIHEYVPVGLFEITPAGYPVPAGIVSQVEAFRDQIATFERYNNIPYVLSRDGKNDAYYFMCHIPAREAVELLDYDAAIDPSEQEEYRANREILWDTRAFRTMITDAEDGREFVDLVVEYDSSYREDTPLKLWGGQHRTKAIEAALANEPNRYHTFRVYLGLTKKQRADVSIICNTNIAISNDLLDRMQETLRGPQLRDWCQTVNLLRAESDFAGRKNAEGILTVRLARTIAVGYFAGVNFEGDVWKRPHQPYICKTGEMDLEYDKLLKSNPDLWTDPGFVRMGQELAELHKAQQDHCTIDAELTKNAEFRNKAITPAVLSAWAYTAGLLKSDRQALDRHYSLSRRWGNSRDPLNALAMTRTSHSSDPQNYRGLGTRMDLKERGRLVEVFLLHAQGQYGEELSPELLKAGVKEYHRKGTEEEAEEAKRRAQEAAQRGVKVRP